MSTSTETCENCGRTIGKLETAHAWTSAVVCHECYRRLKEQAKDAAEPDESDLLTRENPPTVPDPELTAAELRREEAAKLGGALRMGLQGYRPPPLQSALGLRSRGQAWAVAILGLLLTPGIIGIPLLVWGLIADWQFAQNEKQRGPR